MESKPKALELIHFNDVYEIGRAPRFFTEALKRNWWKKLRLFSGDILFPAMLSLCLNGKPMAHFLEVAQVEYSAIGNHDVDCGEEVFAQLTSTPEHKTQWLMCNYKRKKDNKNLCDALDSVVIERGGFTIGMFSVLDEDWLESCNLSEEDYHYTPFEEACKQKSKELREAGCDLIIALTHMCNKSDRKALRQQNDIDIILGGHDHVYMVDKANEKLLLKSGAKFQMFSDVKITLDSVPVEESPDDYYFMHDSKKSDNPSFFKFSLKRGEKFLNVMIERVAVDKNAQPHPELEEYYNSQAEVIKNRTSTRLCRFRQPVNLNSILMRKSENPLANVLMDALRVKLDVDIAAINSGGMRGNKTLEPGDCMTEFDLMTFDPYRDYLKYFDLPGKVICELVSHAYDGLPDPDGKFLHFSGLKVKVNTKSSPKINVQDILFDEKPIEPEKSYRISLPCFVAEGRDGYTMLEDKQMRSFHRKSFFNQWMEFFNLVKKEEYRKEFDLFKSKFKDVTSATIRSIKKEERKPPLCKSLTDLPPSEHNQEGLKKLDDECLKRLLLYELIDEIAEVGGDFVISFEGKPDNRISIE